MAAGVESNPVGNSRVAAVVKRIAGVQLVNAPTWNWAKGIREGDASSWRAVS